MAQISVTTMQATLDSSNTKKAFNVLKHMALDATYDLWYVVAGVYQSANPTIVPGRARWCRTTIANDAATQAGEVKTALAG